MTRRVHPRPAPGSPACSGRVREVRPPAAAYRTIAGRRPATITPVLAERSTIVVSPPFRRSGRRQPAAFRLSWRYDPAQKSAVNSSPPERSVPRRAESHLFTSGQRPPVAPPPRRVPPDPLSIAGSDPHARLDLLKPATPQLPCKGACAPLSRLSPLPGAADGAAERPQVRRGGDAAKLAIDSRGRRRLRVAASLRLFRRDTGGSAAAVSNRGGPSERCQHGSYRGWPPVGRRPWGGAARSAGFAANRRS